MFFDHKSLTCTSTPDPLWLYKAGTGMISSESYARAHASGRLTMVEAQAITDEIKAALKAPEHVGIVKTALSPLVDVIVAEAKALGNLFGSAHRPHELEQRIAHDVLDSYANSAALVHMQRTGKISDAELTMGAALQAKRLNAYGANGLDAFWHEVGAGRNFFATLKNHPESFVPEQCCGWENRDKRAFTRAEYFETELAHAIKGKTLTPEAHAAAEEGIIKRMMGAECRLAKEARETLLRRYITSGKPGPFADLGIQIKALHRSSSRADEMLKPLPTPSLRYVDSALEPNQYEMGRIRQGKAPESLVEHIDHAFGKQRPGQEKIARDLRAMITHIKHGGSPASDAPSLSRSLAVTDKQKASPPSEPPNIKSAADSALPTAKGHAWLRIGGTALFGAVAIDGITHLYTKDEHTDEKRISFGRVTEIAVGVAGVAAAWMLKDKTIAQAIGKSAGKTI